jgi:SAM-dependent methyltransferase
METGQSKQATDPYQKDGGREYHETIHGGLGEYGYSLVAGRRAAKQQPHILSTDSVLDYGTGPGWNLAKIKAKSVKGFDISESMRSVVEAKGVEFTNEIKDSDREVYVVVICSHVLEHLKNPTMALEQIFKCLKPGGKALFFVPFDFRNRFRKYDVAEPNHHFYTWNVQNFGNLAALCGFIIVEGRLHRFGYERIVARWIERLNLPAWSYPFFLKIILLIKPDYEVAFVVKKPFDQ